MNDFFPARPTASPTIYAFASTHPDHAGLLKVGYTERIAADRIAEQFPSGLNAYRIELIEPAMRGDGSSFTDHDIHRHLRAKGIKNTTHEWFKCTVNHVRAAVVAVRERTANVEDRTLSFGMRPEQRKAVERTADYFAKAKTEQPGQLDLQRRATGQARLAGAGREPVCGAAKIGLDDVHAAGRHPAGG